MSKPRPDRLELLIHQVGDFTKQVDQIKTGTKVHLDGPYGLFNREVNESQQPIILYALGTGIVPLLSLAEEYAGRKPVHLIWSTNSQQNYLANRIKLLQTAGVKVDWQQHRFSNEKLSRLLSPAELSQGEYFIVGSAPVVLKVRKKLHHLGIAKSRLHDEHLTM